MDTNRGQFTELIHYPSKVFFRGQFLATKVGCTETKTDLENESPHKIGLAVFTEQP